MTAFLASFLVAGAADYLDSLESRLNYAPPVDKIAILNQLASSSISVSPERSLDYARKAYELSVANSYLKGKADALNNLGTFYESRGDYNKALEYHKQCLALRLELKEPGDIAQSYNNLGIVYYGMNNFSSALESYQKSLKIREESGDKREIAKSLNNIGVLFLKWKKLEQALSVMQRLLEVSRGLNDKSAIATAYRAIGQVYYFKGEYNNAIDNYLKELKLREEIGDLDELDDFLVNLGRLYYSVQRYSLAIEYYKKAINIIEKKNDKIKLAKVLINMGNVYYDQNDYNKALEYYNWALKLSEEKGSKKGRAILLNNIGLVYKSLGNFPKALDYCLRSLKLKEEIGDNSNLFYPLTSISEIYSKLKDYGKAIDYLEKALDCARQDDQKSQIESAYLLFYKTYSAQGNFREALKYHILYTDLKDTLNSADNNRRMFEMQVKYDIQKKEQDNKALMKKNEIQRNYFLIISALILILLTFIINRYRSKQKANNKLKDMNARIHDQHVQLEKMYQELQTKEEHLRDANATKDKFFTIIAHDLRNPLQAIILSSEFLISKYRYLDGEKLVEIIHTINRSGTHLSNLLTNLLQWSKTQTGKIDFNPDKVLISNLIRDNINLVKPYADKKKIAIQSSIDDNIFVFADPNMATAIIRNLVSNATKFTGEGGRIDISASVRDSFAVISVNDTGIGLNQDDILKLFRIDVHNATIGSSAEKGTGLGLILCKEFIEMNGGSIWVESQEGIGSSFRFSLPLYKDNGQIKQLSETV